MKCIVSTACVFCVLVAVSFAAPISPAQFSASSNLQIGGSSSGSTGLTATGTAAAGGGGGLGGLTDVLSTIDIPGLLRSVNSIVKLVGVFCPPLSQVLDNVIQNVTSVAFRVFGRAILRNGLGGGGGSSSSSGSTGSRVNVVLPTYPPDEDDDYDEDEAETSPGSEDNVDLRISQSSTTAASVQSGETASPANDDDNTVAKRHVRVIRETAAEKEEEAEEDDQDGAESAPEPAEDLSNVDAEDDADRNKRYLPFGLGGSVSGHGSTGGSGNFLFDIIRLVAGSGATEESDERAHGPGGVAEVDIAKGVSVGHTGEGIPGPITRLFVVANRGLANLVQDLILRLASTSERLVNFKARLVTSLI